MSYILEALKKSDRQRQRGATPTLPTVQMTAAVARQSLFLYYGLFAAILLGAGIAIGWLHPWQAELPVRAAEPIAAKPAIQVSHQATPATLHEPPEMPGKTVLPMPNSTPAVQSAPRVDAMQQEVPAPVGGGIPGATAPAFVPDKPYKSADPADSLQEQRVISMAELPVSIQQEIPAIAIQFHAHSGIPANRLVGINSRTLHEGESLMPGLKLEQITFEGVIFSYKGYHFQRGIR